MISGGIRGLIVMAGPVCYDFNGGHGDYSIIPSSLLSSSLSGDRSDDAIFQGGSRYQVQSQDVGGWTDRGD
jgi:hypothetical protein